MFLIMENTEVQDNSMTFPYLGCARKPKVIPSSGKISLFISSVSSVVKIFLRVQATNHINEHTGE